MTFIAPAKRDAAPASFFAASSAAPRPARRLRVADEDGARLALGGGDSPSPALLAGKAIEHLARIALG